MKSRFSFLLAVVVLGALLGGCKKNDTGVTADGELYPVTATVMNPAGTPQGGAVLKLKGKEDNDRIFAAITDSSGKATIQAPSGQQTLVAKIGSVLLTEINVNVKATKSGTDIGELKLKLNSLVKILVVKASAEELENVLRDPAVNVTVFDSIWVDDLNDSVAADSARALEYLRQYTLVFSDCDGGNEEGYGPLSRVYKRYIEAGGKIYGGHYNFYHLQKIFPPYFTQEDLQSYAADYISVVDSALSSYTGITVARWNSGDTRELSGYEKFTDLPQGAKVYGVIQNGSPQTAVIVECDLGSGKFLWTDYHNQDVIMAPEPDSRLARIVRYFLYSL